MFCNAGPRAFEIVLTLDFNTVQNKLLYYRVMIDLDQVTKRRNNVLLVESVDGSEFLNWLYMARYFVEAKSPLLYRSTSALKESRPQITVKKYHYIHAHDILDAQ